MGWNNFEKAYRSSLLFILWKLFDVFLKTLFVYSCKVFMFAYILGLQLLFKRIFPLFVLSLPFSLILKRVENQWNIFKSLPSWTHSELSGIDIKESNCKNVLVNNQEDIGISLQVIFTIRIRSQYY